MPLFIILMVRSILAMDICLLRLVMPITFISNFYSYHLRYYLNELL